MPTKKRTSFYFMIRRILSVMLTIAFLFSISNTMLSVVSATPAETTLEESNLSFSINPALTSEEIPPCVSQEICIWEPKYWCDSYVGFGTRNQNWLTNAAPFSQYGHVFTATGGRGHNNWYHEDINGNPIYDFDRFIESMDNILQSGLKPIIVIGNMPNDLSSNGDDYGGSTLWGNRYGPKDWTKYYQYITALASKLVSKYGTEELSSWKFRIMTEPDYDEWWKGTMEEYEKLYDYTVSALQEQIGKENLTVGPGNFCITNWDLDSLLDHFESGTNYYTGTIGTQCNFLSISCYEYQLAGTSEFDKRIPMLIDLAASHPGLNIKDWNIGEGGQLTDWEGKYLSWCHLGDECGASAFAALFKHGLDMNVSYTDHGNWLFDETYYDDYHVLKGLPWTVAQMYGKMEGSLRTPIFIKGNKNSSGNEVDGIAAVDRTKNKMYVFLYNTNEQRDYVTENITVSLNNLTSVTDKGVTIEHYRLDENHSNWYTQYEKDFADYPKDTTNYSVYAPQPKLTFQSEEAKKLWEENYAQYMTYCDPQKYEDDAVVQPVNNTIEKQISMPGHSISLLVLSNVQTSTATMTDDLPDTEKTMQTSSNIGFKTDSAPYIGDTSRLISSDGNAAFVSYQQQNLQQASVTYFSPVGTTGSVNLFSSSDGVVWAPISVDEQSQQPCNGTKSLRTTVVCTLPSGDDYFKAEIPSGNAAGEIQIGKVDLISGNTNSQYKEYVDSTVKTTEKRTAPAAPSAPNIAKGKPYTSSAAASVEDTALKELTDGKKNESYYDRNDSAWAGWSNQKEYYHTVDLQGVYPIATASIRLLCQSRHQIYWPDEVRFEYSNDNVSFQTLAETDYRSEGDVRTYYATASNAPEARYLRVVICNSSRQGSWSEYADEIEVYPEWENVAYQSTNNGLTDGTYGENTVSDTAWKKLSTTNGINEQILDFGKICSVSKITTDFLQNQDENILWPSLVSISVSCDGITFTPIGNAQAQLTDMNYKKYILDFSQGRLPVRYIKIIVTGIEDLYADEIEVWGIPASTTDNLALGKSYQTVGIDPENNGYYDTGFPDNGVLLTDGINGSNDFRDGLWSGKWSKGMYHQTVDLGSVCTITGATANFLDLYDDGICWPQADAVNISVSTDGVTFQPFAMAEPGEQRAHFKTYSTNASSPVNARFVRFEVNCNSQWTFCDELQVFGMDAMPISNLALNKAYERTIEVETKKDFHAGYEHSGVLTNGASGSANFHDTQWNGYWINGTYHETIDLGKLCSVQNMNANFLQVSGDGIYWPADNAVSFSYSIDGKIFFDFPVLEKNTSGSSFCKITGKSTSGPVAARYVRVNASAAGDWIFCDEIQVFGTPEAVIVAQADPIEVTCAPESRPELPELINVTYSNGARGKVAVNWNALPENIQEGEQVTGKIAETYVVAHCTIHLSDVISVSQSAVNTKSGELPKLPEYIPSTFANGTSGTVCVTWDTVYPDQCKTGSFVVKGTVPTLQQKATCRVTVVPVICKYSTVQVVTSIGEMPTLPKTICAENSDGEQKQVTVDWDTITSKQLSQEGTFIISGTVDGEALRAECIITVYKNAARAKTYTTQLYATDPTESGFNAGRVVLTDGKFGTPATNDLCWNKISVKGTYTETLDLEENTSIFYLYANFLQLEDVYWPTEGAVTFSYSTDGIHFTDLGRALNNSGEHPYFLKYYLDLQDQPVTARYLRMTVASDGKWIFTDEMEAWTQCVQVQSIDPINVATVIDAHPQLPSKVKVYFTDGTSTMLPVEWPAISESQIAQTGSFTLTGTLLPYRNSVLCSVQVDADTTNIHRVTFENTGESSIADQLVAHGNCAFMPDNPKKSGWSFIGWYSGDTAFNFKEIVRNDLRLTAKWSKLPIQEIPDQKVFISGKADTGRLALEDGKTYYCGEMLGFLAGNTKLSFNLQDGLYYIPINWHSENNGGFWSIGSDTSAYIDTSELSDGQHVLAVTFALTEYTSEFGWSDPDFSATVTKNISYTLQKKAEPVSPESGDTNSHENHTQSPPDCDGSSVPNTGESSYTLLLWAILLFSVLGILVTYRNSKIKTR